MTDEEFAAKLRAESHIDEIAQVSKRGPQTIPDTKNHSFAKDGFNYRTAFFEDFDGQYYKLTLSVGKSGEINTVYNIGKMKEALLPARGSKAAGNNSDMTGIRPFIDAAPHKQVTMNEPIDTASAASNTDSIPRPEVNVKRNSLKRDTATTSNNITYSRQFKRWFGDWDKHTTSSSAVVNEDGTPKIVYRGTPRDGFTEFDSFGLIEPDIRYSLKRDNPAPTERENPFSRAENYRSETGEMWKLIQTDDADNPFVVIDDEEQFQRYKTVLGKENMPESLDSWKDLKYNNVHWYEYNGKQYEMKLKYRKDR